MWLQLKIGGLANPDTYSYEEKPKLPKLEINLPLRVAKPYPGGEIIVAETNTTPDLLKLAAQNPTRGQNVFYAVYNEGSMQWLDAVVAYSDTNRIVLHLLNSPDGDFLPGYPIVNHAGEVVGLQTSSDDVNVSGVSVDALRRAISNQSNRQIPSAPRSKRPNSQQLSYLHPSSQR